MTLASHNSISYAKPQWWFKSLNFTSKCQNKDIIEQFNCGVRLFNLRARLDNDKWVGAHGLATYKHLQLDTALQTLSTLATTTEDIIDVNIVLETLWWDKDPIYIAKYKEWYESLFDKYPNLRISGGAYKLPKYTVVSDKGNGISKGVIHCIYKSQPDNYNDKVLGIHVGKWIKYIKMCFIIPKFWAWRRNKKAIKQYASDERYLFLDFV